MASITPTSDSRPSATEALKDSAIRRKVLADIAKIRHEILESGMKDRMTQKIHSWCNAFSEDCQKMKDSETVVKFYVTEIRLHLVDPLSQTPLDDNTVLGSDGHTYGGQSLRLCLSSLQPPIRYRSPMNINDPTLFTTVQHRVARFMVEWLKQYPVSDDAAVAKLYKNQEELKQFAEKFATAHPIIDLPTEESERKRIKAEERAARRRDIRAAQEERKASAEATLSEEAVKKAAEAIRENIRNQGEEIRRETTAQFQQTEQKLKEAEEKGKKQADDIAQELKEIKERVEAVKRGTQILETEYKSLDERVSANERTDQDLKLRVEEVKRQKREEAKDSALGALGKIALTVAACAFAAWALPKVLAAAGVTGLKTSVVPLSGGGVAGLLGLPL